MTTPSRAELWQRLAAAGLVDGPLPERSEPASPWFVRAMLGVAGWIGALFLLGFVGVGMAFVFKNEAAALVVGALCCAAAFVVFARAGRSELAHQFGLAVSLAGQVMFIFGLHETVFDSESSLFFLAVAVFEGVLAYLLASFVHRVWSAFAAATAFGYAMNMFGLYGAGTALIGAILATIWLREELWAARGAFWRAIAWGLAFSFVQPSAYFSDLGRWAQPIDPAFPITWIIWVKPILAAGVLIYVVYRILERYGVEISTTTGVSSLAASAIVGAATLRAPGVMSSLVIVLLGFACGGRALFGFGIVAMLAYLSYFYYSLHLTLLLKSFALAGTGVALVVMWAVMRRLFPEGPEVRGSKVRGFSMRRLAIALGGVMILLVANVGIYQKQQLVESGRVVLLELAPVGPRSLMQGDYMALRFRVADEAFRSVDRNTLQDGRLVLTVDERNVGTFTRFDSGGPLGPGEVVIRYRVRDNTPKFATNAFFFEEGTADAYALARFGEFRVSPQGDAILTKMRGEKLEVLGPFDQR